MINRKTGYCGRQKNIVVMPATIKDIEDLAALEIALFNTGGCARKRLLHLLRHNYIVVAKEKHAPAPVGYAILLRRKNSRKMRIYAFGVIENARNAGVGAKMLSALESFAKTTQHYSLTLEVGDSNLAALRFYEKYGFQQCGFRLGFYEDGGHAILMRKQLN